MRFVLSLLALAAVAAPAAAAPQTGEEVLTVRISYDDIDLSTAAGREALEQRVQVELREACTIERNNRYGYGRTIVDQKCMNDARAEAQAEVERVATAAARRGRQVAAN
ncbi:MAG: UrcA family protein [Pseudomonadota bacterium]